MAVLALDPNAYGFPTRCYVCESDNPAGLRIPFTFDEETRIVHAEFTLGPEYSGAPKYVHGGVVQAVLDEAMAWAAIAAAGRFAVMRETTTTFEHGVLVGELHRVEAEVDTAGTIRMEASAKVLNEAGKRCARARARMVILSPDSAKGAIGAVEGEATKFLRRQK